MSGATDGVRVIVMKQRGAALSKTRITNDAAEMMRAVGKAWPGAGEVVEATDGWHWAA